LISSRNAGIVHFLQGRA